MVKKKGGGGILIGNRSIFWADTLGIPRTHAVYSPEPAATQVSVSSGHTGSPGSTAGIY